MLYKANEAAAAIHAFMCKDKRFGYTQGPERWGTASGQTARFSYEGFTFNVPIGDYDCSSSVVKAWQLALEPTDYAGALGRDGFNSCGQWVSWYTGNMEPGFRASGLFQSKSAAFFASPGDLYLDSDSHVAMCQTQTPDVLSEFLINESGGITGGITGDQTGSESRIAPFYDFGIDCILHYNGKADFETEDNMEPVDVWAYKNPDITKIDAYAHLLETHDETKQILREVVRLGSEVSQLKLELAKLKSERG